MPASIELSVRQQAFADYCELRGKFKRDEIFRRLSETYHRRPCTIESWYRKFKWVARAEAKDVKLAAKMEIQTEENLLDVRRRQMKICKAVQGKFIQHLAQDQVEMTLPGARGMMEHELVLHGYNPNRPNLSININSPDHILSTLGRGADLTDAQIASVLKFLDTEKRGSDAPGIESTSPIPIA